MNKIPLPALAVAVCVLAALPVAAQNAPWQKLYTGAEATGPKVIGLWQFQPGQPGKDVSGHGHDLTLHGQGKFVAEGPFGGALESFAAGETNDKPQGASTKDADDLTPAGAFTLEAWITAKPELDALQNVFLIDKKYITYVRATPDGNWDYCLYLQRTSPNHRRLMAGLGFGTDSANVTGPELELKPGEWKHIAFTYDGAGRCRFFVDGKLAAKVYLEGRGPVTNGNYELVIGDRVGSTHSGFPGYIAQVRLCNGIVPYLTGGLTISTGAGRTAFVRMEKNVSVPVTLGNDTPSTLTQGQARVSFAGSTKTINLPDLAANQEYALPIAVDTSVRPGDYLVKVTASASSGAQTLAIEKSFAISIVGRPLPNQMPVVMWGTGDPERLKAIGFTHHLIGLADYGRIWNAGKPVLCEAAPQVEKDGQMLDDLLRAGLHGAVYLYPGTWVTGDAARRAQYNRIDRGGAVREQGNVCGNFPQIRQFCYNVGASVAQTFGQYPALDASLVHSEVRDESNLCFHDFDKAAFRKAAGFDIPADVAGKNGFSYTRIKNFPANRVVRDDDPYLTFYRWFWKDGDGWNPLHSEVSRGLHSTGRKDFWTFFDPAVRVPDIWGSGGDVDVISQWTYSYPDPIKIGQATDELFAMAGGKPGQQVMKMTQIIWYRSGTAPKLPEDESKRAQWEKDKPTADFITISPDHMREAFWSKLSRPIRGIMYHGWQSLVETGSTKGYVFTNPETQGVLTELTHRIVRPLGPTLLQVPDRPADVAVLESATSQIFAGRGTYGWSEAWEANMHMILQWAHLQPKILFDETVVRDGLAGYKVLVMPFCDVLTESVVKRIKAFQKMGGIVVADEYLCPAITPDIVIPSYKRTGKAEEDKAALQKLAASLRQELDPFYSRYGDAPNQDLVLRFRQYGNSDYLFVLNDKRTFGNYVGHHGRVMEKGLANASPVTVARKSGFVYDLVGHKAVPTKVARGMLTLDVTLGPGDGRVYLLTSQRLAKVQVATPARVRRAAGVDFGVSLLDGAGKPVAAVVPAQVQILDPQGREAEMSGYYGVKDGKLKLHLDLASNDVPGVWTVKATELASGLSTTGKFTVAP